VPAKGSAIAIVAPVVVPNKRRFAGKKA
jgi:hypothetical protein